ncbi:hypothetical protein DMA15_12540 [Streptomyces sp. WAC 01529]|uniref:hypothetical protein n=1 Tax=Streptomyces sp. WAC 01529 TaxID=2203205 RepID=UPI000F6B64B8|nr:hypothetical protein [Streptomyces sp. WAC 01529]AZM53313.1 hypothetical protein DMA15_12540 [Streptomyces sp. WAC 01529]
MNVAETLDLFEQIALIDDRVIKTTETEQAAQLTLWAAVLRDVPLAFAGQALGDHYAESAWPVMPKDIAARWRLEARRRLDRHVGTFEPCAHPGLDPDDIPGYRAALRAERDGVRRGGCEPVEFRALLAASDPVPAGRPTDEYLRAREQMRRARSERTESEATA